MQPPVLVDVAASPAAHVSAKPLWRHAVWNGSASEVAGAAVAVDERAAYLSTAAAVCAVALDTGRERWCQGTPATWLARSGPTLATVESDGIIRGRDAATGVARWQTIVGPATAPSERLNEKIWATPSGFLATRSLAKGGSAVAEIGTNGEVLWVFASDVAVAGAPLISSGYAAFGGLAAGASGGPTPSGPNTSATAASEARIFKLGVDGGPLDRLAAGSTPITLRPPQVYSLLERGGQAMGAFALAFDLSVHDLRPGTPEAVWHYAPDQEENSRLPVSGPSCCGSPSRRLVIDDRYVYAAISERLYRYLLAAPDDQRPILMSDAGAFVAGPYAGRVYVGRPDGVWATSFNGRFLNQMLVAPYRLPVAASAMAFSGSTGYVAATDGSLLAFALDDGRPLMRARLTCVGFGDIVVTARRVLFECVAPSPFIGAFPR